MTDIYPYLLSAIKAANDVRTERDVTNGKLDTFISAIAPVMLHGLTDDALVSDADLLSWYADMTPEQAVLICTAYAIPESITDTRANAIREAFLRAWTDEARTYLLLRPRSTLSGA